jgi:hypothetical protein
MPDPLMTRLTNAMKSRVIALTGSDVSAAQVYARDTITFDPSRDKPPSIVIAKTPEQPVILRHRLGWRDVEYPFTVVLFDAGDQSLKASPSWRDKWRDTVQDGLAGCRLDGVTECKKVWVDDAVILDLTAWEQTNIFSAPIHVRVMCRIPKRV